MPTYHFFVCTNCGARISSGSPRFGPETVKCGYCENVLRTGLGQWANYSSGQKILAAIKEYLFPSWTGLRGLDGVIGLMFNVFLTFAVASPIMALAIVSSETNLPVQIVDFLGIFALLFILAFPLFPLYRMIRQSNSFTRTGAPPTWKWLFWGKRIARRAAKDS